MLDANWLRKVVDAVHQRGSFIYLQLFAMGRAASPEMLEKEGPFPLVSSSDIMLTGSSIPPRPLTIPGENLAYYNIRSLF